VGHRVPKELGYGILALQGHRACGCTEKHPCPAHPATCLAGIQHCMYGMMRLACRASTRLQQNERREERGSTQEGALWGCLVHTSLQCPLAT